MRLAICDHYIVKAILIEQVITVYSWKANCGHNAFIGQVWFIYISMYKKPLWALSVADIEVGDGKEDTMVQLKPLWKST